MANNSSDPDNLDITAPFVGERIDQAARVLFAVIGSVMILSAAIGNSTLIVIIVKHFMRKPKRFLQDLFIANLAVGDLLSLGYWFAYTVLDLVIGCHPVFNGTHCTANGVIVTVLNAANVVSLMTISFNRYLHVCHPHLYSRVFTLPRTVHWCLLTWVFSLLLALPPIWGWSTGSYWYNPVNHTCSLDVKGLTVKVIVFLFSVSPPFFIAYFNLAIFRFWRKVRMSLSSRYPLVREEQNRRRKLIAKWKAGIKKKTAIPTFLVEETAVDQGAQLQDDCLDSESGRKTTESSELQDGSGISDQGVLSKPDSSDEETDADADFHHQGPALEMATPTTPLPKSKALSPRRTPKPRIFSRRSNQQSQTIQSKQQILRKESQGKEEAFVRSLVVVSILMFITFVPHAVIVIADSNVKLSAEVHIAVGMLVFLNNSVNWIVYGVMNPTFKRGYVKCIRQVLNACQPAKL